MKVWTMCLGEVSTNCYLLCNEKTGDCIIIDPAAEPERIRKTCDKLQTVPVAILLTHGHYDHMLGADSLRRSYQIPIYAEEHEEALLADSQWNLSGLWSMPYTLKADKTVTDGQILSLAGYSIQVLYTPGHTAGSCCYYVESEKTVFSGDTIFYRSVGRTDFPTSRTRALIASIREKLFVLPDDTVVYPGHGESTTIGDEREHNPAAPYCR